MNETMKSILERRSCRAFESRSLTEVEINQIVEAGKYAASANNKQPWHFTVVTDQALMSSIVEACREVMLNSGNPQQAERAKNPDFHNFHHAPAVILISGDESNRFANGDCANATQNMALAAHALGLGSCYIASFLAGFTGEKGGQLYKALGIPQGYKLYFSLAVGHRSAPDAPASPRAENLVNYVR